MGTPDNLDFDYLAPSPLEADQRWSTWDDIGVLAGPTPWPDWVVTEDAAIDTELGIVKSGKEAEVFLVERATDQRRALLAAKRFRKPEHRQFHRSAGYTEGRQLRRSRDRRAVAKNSTYGRRVQASQWAAAEFDVLGRLWSAGLPVPYPVQLDGEEILMELIALADGSVAPRLAQVRPQRTLLETYWEQLVEAMAGIAALGLTHGDLSAFNILATEERLVFIDLPQAVDIVTNPQGMTYLTRDCRNICRWFSSRGLDVDADTLLAELVTYAW